jgi:hypothetical protein
MRMSRSSKKLGRISETLKDVRKEIFSKFRISLI